MNDPIDYKKIRNLRIDSDLGQKELAAKLNISPSAYSRLERGVRKIRMEHLEIIAPALGKDIADFLKNSKKSRSIEGHPESLKSEIDLLESMMYLICAGIEQELDYMDNRYISKYEPIPYSYEEFLNENGPKIALSQFKKYIKEYGELKDRPYEWYRERMEELYPNINEKEKNPDWINSLIEYRSKFEFNGYHPFCDFFGKDEYEHFNGKSDEFIMEFILDKSNFDFVEIIMNDGVGSGYSYSTEDYYSAFKDMLEENHVVKLLFQYGFLGQNRYSYFWNKYCEEKGEANKIHVNSNDQEIIQEIHNRMQEIVKKKSPNL